MYVEKRERRKRRILLCDVEEKSAEIAPCVQVIDRILCSHKSHDAGLHHGDDWPQPAPAPRHCMSMVKFKATNKLESYFLAAVAPPTVT